LPTELLPLLKAFIQPGCVLSGQSKFRPAARRQGKPA
jgi:hypothetical protein